METKGFELKQNSSEKTPKSKSRGTESGTPGKSSHPPAAIGTELQTVIEAWPSLPAGLRARILGMVEGAIAARAEG